jgi:hypothetical protein
VTFVTPLASTKVLGCDHDDHGGYPVRWFSFYAVAEDGRRALLARITCRSDAHAMDRTSAMLWPGAMVFEGSRHVGTLPPEDPEERRIVPPKLAKHSLPRRVR